ncbi:uncharacterized protein LOC122089621 [Macadamia integrifolia]|uniref:uncharacterized protein LOC122089621 n=1 Tax=Macadamia integrifolia TaxID=60698 RepID=UPI001C4F89F5|nr:uncharacterized protein LOC122089621 [Macadamia integrifolia]
MDVEYQAIMKNNTWKLVPHESGITIIARKWVYRVKTKSDGSIKRNKVRHVAKGFNQQLGLDFSDTFSPVVKAATIRTIRAIAVPRFWKSTSRLIILLLYIDDIILTGNGITFKPSSLNLIGAYTDADWAGCPNTRHSTSGFCTYLGDNLISWSSKKQPTMSKSSTEAECNSLAVTLSELLWISYLLKDLKVLITKPLLVYCDNLSTTQMAVNSSVLHARTKHIEVDYHFVRDLVVTNKVQVKFVCFETQVVDIFTKGIFSIKSVWEENREKYQKVSWFSLIWNSSNQPRQDVFAWRLVQNRLPTDENVSRRGVQMASRCSLCGKYAESMSHLFYNCEFARSLWRAFCEDFDVQRKPYMDMPTLIAWWKQTAKSLHFKKVWISGFSLVPSVIWQERNARIFEGVSKSSRHCFAMIKSEISFQMTATTGSPLSFSSLLCAKQLGISRVRYKPREVMEIFWCPPQRGWVKLNSDGCSLGNPGKAGAGGIFRNENLEILQSFRTFLGVHTNFETEMIAVITGLEFARDMGITHLWIECYSVAVVLLISKGRIPWVCLQRNEGLDHMVGRRELREREREMEVQQQQQQQIGRDSSSWGRGSNRIAHVEEMSSPSFPPSEDKKFHEQDDPASKKPRWKEFLTFVGPGFLVSIAYLDPGNLETDLQSGANHRYELLWVVLIGLLFVFIIQSLAANLGVTTGKHLSELCKLEYPKYVTYCLWFLAEIGAIAADIPEVIGTAFALNILFHIPTWAGVLITGSSALLLLGLQRYGVRKLEMLIALLIFVMAACYFAELSYVKPPASKVLEGMFIPKLSGGATGDAIALLGAILSPPNLFLHSALVLSRKIPPYASSINDACRFYMIETGFALFIAFLINVTMVIVSGTVCFADNLSQQDLDRCNNLTLDSASFLLKNALGKSSSTIYAIALLASGQSSTITGTYAGQFIMQGFLNLKMKNWKRNLVTRTIAIAPSLIVSIIGGSSGAGRLIIVASMMLSFQLPFALIPLLKFSGSANKMGPHKNSFFIIVITWIMVLCTIGINSYYLSTSYVDWLTHNNLPKVGNVFIGIFVFPLMVIYILSLFYLTFRKDTVVTFIDAPELDHNVQTQMEKGLDGADDVNASNGVVYREDLADIRLPE